MERKPKLIKFPKTLVQKIECYQKEYKIKTFSKTVYLLIEEGLKRKQDDQQKRE
ncbi:hypothetical protein [Shouchella patagoniensis]|uniref:hypothetical protein n=1 Tax=Shouchella patagoniensis TaxID=228576 RepID=UPI001475B3DC|nr:hypothetical protein [Shouchella patagoniensis]